jgi:hypothetical protein
MIVKICKFIIILLLIMLGPSACENCPDTPAYFSINGLNIYNGKFMGYSWKIIGIEEPVPWSTFFMRVEFESTFFSKNESSAGAGIYADCFGAGYKGSKIGVDTLYLVTLNNYNEDFHQNDTINTITQANDRTYDAGGFYSIPDYITQNKVTIAEGEFGLKIVVPPSADIGDYKFRLIFILNNGEIFVAETDKVRITK